MAKDRLNSQILEDLGVEVVTADLRDEHAIGPLLRDAEYVFHAAGVTRARRNIGYYFHNHGVTRAFLHACLRHCTSLRRFVYISSLTAMGPQRTEPLTEDSPCHLVSHYGRSKLLAEIEVRQWGHRLPFTILRPAGVYDPWDRETLQYFMMVAHGLTIILGLRNKYMNMMHVHDLVDGIISAATHPDAMNGVFFLGNERPITTERLSAAIERTLQRKTIRIHISKPLIYAIGACSELAGRMLGKSVMFNIQKARDAVQGMWTCSIDRAVTLLGFQPKIALDAGIAATCEWYRKNGWM